MPSLTKINSGNLKDLLNKGVSSRTIELLENANKAGTVFKNIDDLQKIGISQDDINKMKTSISLTPPKLEKLVKSSIIETDLKGFSGYTISFKYQSIKTQEYIESVNPISFNDKTEIKYDDKNSGNIFLISVKAPNGDLTDLEYNNVKGKIIEVPKAAIGLVKLKVTRPQPIMTIGGKSMAPSKLKGKLLSNNPSRKLEKVQLVIEVALEKDSNSNPIFFPICYAETEESGYFFTSQLQFTNEGDGAKIIEARAKIALPGIDSINIHLDHIDPATRLGQLPEKLIIYIEEKNISDETSACSCETDELNFHDKKVLDEFSFYSVVRTTEPLIDAFEINDVEEVDLTDIVDNEEVRKLVSGTVLPPAIINEFISKNGSITINNYSSLLSQASKTAQLQNLTNIVAGEFIPQAKGRVNLNGKHSIDWDEKPTIYQATSIAHGHILHFKQEWFADGYTIGDLLYSLPLAPGQKKQIVVFDWDRKDSASRTDQLDYQDSLYNSLSRDRDVNEVASAALREHIEGESSATTMSAATGVGALVGPVLMGGAAGIGHSFSSASQDGSRSTTASSRQHITDRTTQAASSIRSQRSTVIQTASQGERFQVSSESVANYNHCHAMTIQYFEVLRHFEIRTRLANVQECLFIPLRITPFDRKKALRWRDILARSLKKRNLVSGFDALERIEQELESTAENYYDQIGLPKNRFAEEELEYFEGEIYLEFQLSRPRNTDDDEFEPANWSFFPFILGDVLEFYNTYLKYEKRKDEAFIKHAGPKIVETVLNEMSFYAVKNGPNGISKKLPVDATLLSDFKNKQKLNISLRMSSETVGIKREDIDFIRITINNSNERSTLLKNLENGNYLKIIVHSGSMRYRTKNLHEYLFSATSIKNDLTLNGDDIRIFTPLSAKALRKPRLDDIEISNTLLHHLNENIEHYHQCIWLQMNPQRRFMLLDGLVAPGKAKGRSVASVVENKLLGIAGNSLIMPVAPGFQLDPTLDDRINLYEHYYEDPKDPIHIALPTKGVFAEAVMGRCNSCEKKDESRFWRWEESPIPDSPTSIGQITVPTPQNIQPTNLQAKDFASPIINLQNAPNIPDPQGYGALAQLLGNANLFKDITGLTENQQNALAALQSAYTTAQSFGNQAAALAPLFAKQQALDQIKNAKENGLITEEQAQSLTTDTLNSIIGNSGSKSSQTIDDISKVDKKVKANEMSEGDAADVKKLIKDSVKSDLDKTDAITSAIDAASTIPGSSIEVSSDGEEAKFEMGSLLASAEARDDGTATDADSGIITTNGYQASLKSPLITEPDFKDVEGFVFLLDTLNTKDIIPTIIKRFLAIKDGIDVKKKYQDMIDVLNKKEIVEKPGKYLYAAEFVKKGVLPLDSKFNSDEIKDIKTEALNIIIENAYNVAKAVNPHNGKDALTHIISLVNSDGIDNINYLCYILATAHIESRMGDWITERSNGISSDTVFARDAYFFNANSDGKASYNGINGNHLAGNQLKEFGVITVQADIDLWNSKAYPESQPANVKIAARKCDYYRFIGRGFAQVTGRGNYNKWCNIADYGNIDFIAQPEKISDYDIAAKIIVRGMLNGNFAGPKLSQYDSEAEFNATEARHIVNGSNKKHIIAALAKDYKKSLLKVTKLDESKSMI